MSDTRRYDIDWLRVIAIWLLIFYHVAIAFRPWGALIGFIQNNDALDALEIPMYLLNVWRIPLLFVVSGMGVSFAMRKRAWKELLLERTRRILVPLLFGSLTIVPLHVWLWMDYYHQDVAYVPNFGHLWFLANIFAYVLILLPLFSWLKSHPESSVGSLIRRVMRHPAGLLVIMAGFVAEGLIVQPEAFELYATTWHGFFLGLVAFFFGFLMIYSGEEFWAMLKRIRWVLLTGTVALASYRVVGLSLKAPGYLLALESSFWVLTIFAFGRMYLNRSGNALRYFSQAAYPVYILHMAVLYGLSYLLFPLEMNPWIKFLLVTAGTLAGCYGLYEFLIRRIRWLRPLFGLKVAPKSTSPVAVVE